MGLICSTCGHVKTNSVSSIYQTQSQEAVHSLNILPGAHMDPFNAVPVNVTQGTYLILNHSESRELRKEND